MEMKKKKSKGFMTQLKKQMAQLTVNYASRRQRQDSGINWDLDEDSSAEDIHVSATEASGFKRSYTLPYKLSETACHTPGVVGLRNHGNTCFINAVVQCLSHTDLLAEYFVTDHFKNDRIQNKRKVSGTNKEVTEQFAQLLKAIWSNQYNPEMTLQFQLLIGKHGSQFIGESQQDAQEFLLWLLDQLHEDLNTANRKKSKKTKKFYGGPEEIRAAQTLADHLRYNSSFVQQLFQAQFRSSLTCCNCHYQSCTFDPFLCISLPIPMKLNRRVLVNVVSASQQTTRIGLTVNDQADIRDLRGLVSQETATDFSRILTAEINKHGFLRTLADNDVISALKDLNSIYCIELPRQRQTSSEDGEFIDVCWVNLEISGNNHARFGGPCTLQVNRETSLRDLQNLILKKMGPVCDESVFQAAERGFLFRIRVHSELLPEGTYLNTCMEYPLYDVNVDEALSICDPSSGVPNHLKLILEWPTLCKQRFIVNSGDCALEQPSVAQVKKTRTGSQRLTLEDCFKLYTKAEELGPENAWDCPTCNHKQKVIKKLTLWTCPDVLIVHLKRFKQSSKQGSTSKLPVMVDFPLYGLNLGNHVVPKASISSQSDTDSGVWKSTTSLTVSSKKSKRSPNADIYHQALLNSACRTPLEDNIYDLYAVCNHHGNDLASGHYTAYCRNPTDGYWYLFDDSRVTRIAEETGIISNSAYILFYKRRTNPGTSGTSNSSLGSDHWAFRMNSSSRKQEKQEPEFKRNSLRYSTLQLGKRKGSIWSLNNRRSSAMLV